MRIPTRTTLVAPLALLFATSVAALPAPERPVASTLTPVGDLPLATGAADGGVQAGGTESGGLVVNTEPLNTGTDTESVEVGSGIITVPAITPGWTPTAVATTNVLPTGLVTAPPAATVTAEGIPVTAAPAATLGSSGYNASGLPFQISAPGGPDQWWVLNGTNYLFVTPPAGVDLRVGLTNANRTILSDHGGWWDLGGFRCERSQNPPVCVIAIGDLGSTPPGPGYMLYITPENDKLTIYGVSELFEIKPPGSKAPTQFTVTVKSTEAGISFVPQETPSAASGARRTGDWAGVGAVAAVVAALLLA